jgi:hypothetical protein
MSGKTMKLLRKTAGKTGAKYDLLKKAYKQAPAPLRAQGKSMMRDLAEVERQHLELAKRSELKDVQPAGPDQPTQ